MTSLISREFGRRWHFTMVYGQFACMQFCAISIAVKVRQSCLETCNFLICGDRHSWRNAAGECDFERSTIPRKISRTISHPSPYYKRQIGGGVIFGTPCSTSTLYCIPLLVGDVLGGAFATGFSAAVSCGMFSTL